MANTRPRLIRFLTPLVAFGLAIAMLLLLNRTSAPPQPASSGGADISSRAARTTDGRIRALDAALRANPNDPTRNVLLGNAYIQKAREAKGGDYQARAEVSFERALNQDPENAGALAGMGTLALSRHDFAGGLAYGRRALEQAPGAARIHGVIADALNELGRYEQAERVLQRMVDLKPNLDSYSRVSYFRELRGDLAGAVDAMRLAASAGGGAASRIASTAPARSPRSSRK